MILSDGLQESPEMFSAHSRYVTGTPLVKTGRPVKRERTPFGQRLHCRFA